MLIYCFLLWCIFSPLFLVCYFVSFSFVLFPFLPLSSRCVKETDEIILRQLYFICSYLSENTRVCGGIIHLFGSRWRCSVKQRDARRTLCTWRGTERRFKVPNGHLSCTNCVIRPKRMITSELFKNVRIALNCDGKYGLHFLISSSEILIFVFMSTFGLGKSLQSWLNLAFQVYSKTYAVNLFRCLLTRHSPVHTYTGCPTS